jgi:hypothetical protein
MPPQYFFCKVEPELVATMLRQGNAMAKENGFTLIEIMIVLNRNKLI